VKDQSVEKSLRKLLAGKRWWLVAERSRLGDFKYRKRTSRENGRYIDGVGSYRLRSFGRPKKQKLAVAGLLKKIFGRTDKKKTLCVFLHPTRQKKKKGTTPAWEESQEIP